MEVVRKLNKGDINFEGSQEVEDPLDSAIVLKNDSLQKNDKTGEKIYRNLDFPGNGKEAKYANIALAKEILGYKLESNSNSDLEEYGKEMKKKLTGSYKEKGDEEYKKHRREVWRKQGYDTSEVPDDQLRVPGAKIVKGQIEENMIFVKNLGFNGRYGRKVDKVVNLYEEVMRIKLKNTISMKRLFLELVNGDEKEVESSNYDEKELKIRIKEDKYDSPFGGSDLSVNRKKGLLGRFYDCQQAKQYFEILVKEHKDKEKLLIYYKKWFERFSDVKDTLYDEVCTQLNDNFYLQINPPFRCLKKGDKATALHRDSATLEIEKGKLISKIQPEKIINIWIPLILGDSDDEIAGNTLWVKDFNSSDTNRTTFRPVLLDTNEALIFKGINPHASFLVKGDGVRVSIDFRAIRLSDYETDVKEFNSNLSSTGRKNYCFCAQGFSGHLHECLRETLGTEIVNELIKKLKTEEILDREDYLVPGKMDNLIERVENLLKEVQEEKRKVILLSLRKYGEMKQIFSSFTYPRNK